MAGLVAAVCELALAPPLGPPALSSTSFRCVESASFLPNLFSGSLATLDSGVVTCRCWMLPLGLRPGGLEACGVPRGRGRRGGVRRSPVCPLSSRGPTEQEVAGVEFGEQESWRMRRVGEGQLLLRLTLDRHSPVPVPQNRDFRGETGNLDWP